MNSVFVVVRLNEDGSIAEIVSAHPNEATALNAEHLYRMYQMVTWTDVREIKFEV